ncbi:glycosyltransferase [Pseudomonas mosselii]|uniref:glycosyltransferase n=1 Tax=Pseudomonas mosselii TaxID=78327 RepID=UPI0024497A00|nr:glycosyltransferase [Pseudomonas mosselii]MDH1655523.1 glycosyltransferase [Pseudomonas mosselii]MDH1718842.1 glycosyltransferase [Pseudomonas mosselii]MDH1722871.1 glycosyltransferase [Pseudomonas mosselii]
MNILNVMWSGGSPFASIHSVHRQVLAHAPSGAQVTNWLLLGEGLCSGVGQTRSWHLSPRVLKGRLAHGLALSWVKWRLRRALKVVVPDVLLLDGLGVARLLLPVLRQLPDVQVAVLFHGTTRLTRRDVALFRQFPVERLRVAAVSTTLALSLAQGLGRSVQSLRVALNPRAFTDHSLDREQARQALSLMEDGLVLGAVGRLVESKGFEMLIEAFARTRAVQHGARLVILGDGPLRGQLEAQARSLGVGDRVRFYGHREDSIRLYPAFDWLLVPSRSEGLGLVLQEAVLSKVPVVCSDLPVFREQLADAGRYLPTDDPYAWADVIDDCAFQDAGAKASEQWQALAPEQGWQAFRSGSASLLAR